MDSPALSRRQLLQAGTLSALNIAAPGLVMGSDKTDAVGKAIASKKSCIFLLLCGGPSHLDSWDLKPDAPSEIRGPYNPIRTKVPGLHLSELHPKLAQVADQFAMILSVHHPGPISNHFDAMHNLLSGQYVERVKQGVPDGSPYIGSVVAKHLPSERNLVSNAWLIKCVGRPVFCAPNIGTGGYLGSSYAPVFVGSSENHPAMPDFEPPAVYDKVDKQRLASRRELLSSLESDTLQGQPIGRDWNELREMAFDGMTRPEGRQAFEMDREPLAVRERYGMHPLGQNLLLARRMVEAGVRFITVNGWTGPAPGSGKGPPSSSWDMHGGHMGMGNAFGSGSYGMGWCLPRLDEALSALLTDLKERGLLDDTLVVADGRNLAARRSSRPRARPDACIGRTAFPPSWPAAASPAAPSTASPTSTASIPRPTRSPRRTFTRRSCTRSACRCTIRRRIREWRSRRSRRENRSWGCLGEDENCVHQCSPAVGRYGCHACRTGTITTRWRKGLEFGHRSDIGQAPR